MIGFPLIVGLRMYPHDETILDYAYTRFPATFLVTKGKAYSALEQALTPYWQEAPSWGFGIDRLYASASALRPRQKPFLF